jgi:hypothetical protein
MDSTQTNKNNSFVLCPVLKGNLTWRETVTVYGHIPGATNTVEQICLLQHLSEVEMFHVHVG